MIMTCPGCGKRTEVDDKATLAKLDTKYPSQRVVVECSCGETQFILESKRTTCGRIQTRS